MLRNNLKRVLLFKLLHEKSSGTAGDEKCGGKIGYDGLAATFLSILYFDRKSRYSSQ